MKKLSNSFAGMKKSRAAAAALALVPAAAMSEAPRPANHSAIFNAEQNKMPEGRFFCNVNALTQAERIHHVKLTEKLLAMRSETIPTEKGYEFQFDPNQVSITELTDWVVNESKCCPFFDFHIDLEHAGRLLCLRLTGPDGVKPFIESEFGISQK